MGDSFSNTIACVAAPTSPLDAAFITLMLTKHPGPVTTPLSAGRCSVAQTGASITLLFVAIRVGTNLKSSTDAQLDVGEKLTFTEMPGGRIGLPAASNVVVKVVVRSA